MSYSDKPARTLFCALSLAVMTANAAFAADAPPATQPAVAESRVLVKKVAFTGNKTFTSDQLSAQLAADLGRPLTFKDINALARKIEAYYHLSGYRLAKVVVPQQDFAHQDALQLVVLEGWLGKIEVNGNKRYSDQRVIEALKAGGVETAKPFTLEDVERALTRLNRQSGIEVSSTLQPGKELGSTDLVVNLEEAPRVQGALEANNYGNDNTGEYRVIPSLQFADLTGRGDELNLLAMQSLGEGDLHFEYLDYTTPLNARGTHAHAYYSQGNVDIGSQFRVLEIEGDNTSWGLGLSQDFVRSARTIYTAGAWLEYQDLDQSMLGQSTAEDKIRKLRFSFGLDNTDLYGRTLASLDLHQGLGEALGGMDDGSSMSSRAYAHADNDFTKLSFDLTRLQQINARLLVIPRIYGQFSADSLVSSEQWAIGGFGSVAGHPASAYSGDHGVTASVEGRYSLFSDSDRYQLTSRLEHGRIWIKDPLPEQNDSEDLTGFSVGLLARPLKSVDLRLDWGLPVGEKTEDSSYVYAQARYHF